MTKFIDTREAAAFLCIGRDKLYQLTCRREIPCHRIGTKLLFDPDELANWVKRPAEWNGGEK